jgi:hypothetical protein
MVDGKGKGRASNLDNSNELSIDDQSPHRSSSILERVSASATGLAHSAFAAPTSNELSDATTAALTSTGKGRQLGRSSGSLAEGSRSNQQTGLPTSQGQSLPSIRAGHREEHIIDAESEFSSFLDGIDSFTPSSELYNQADPSVGQALDIPLERANGGIDTHRGQAGQVLYNSVDEQQQHDGDAVLSLLSNPSVTTNELEVLSVEDEALNWDLTDQQISRLRTLVDELFPPPDEHISMSAEHPLNLIPHMDSTTTTSDPVPFIDTTLEYSNMHFGQDVPRDAARQMWMEQWEGVLTRYTDEVWGNLLPLVVEARKEIKTIKEGHSGATIEQSKALRRLRLVLNHVRKL